jgi:hypothetical protein
MSFDMSIQSSFASFHSPAWIPLVVLVNLGAFVSCRCYNSDPFADGSEDCNFEIGMVAMVDGDVDDGS